ncbi:hypothetical protein L1077_10490 [Pseudoalteromonas luteoviolacea]|uniref:hypothetical protein n=1 Tax=Pseudoalteromonas luteoviolacea TaxID=43657 RepID=UPI001F294B16|nr:hypothetical protein [Pseudoalteromonas luteoviolacea]MCF6439861.1 hypothetical protein [Pseudoalteromonas luteoviolacea]
MLKGNVHDYFNQLSDLQGENAKIQELNNQLKAGIDNLELNSISGCVIQNQS